MQSACFDFRVLCAANGVLHITVLTFKILQRSQLSNTLNPEPESCCCLRQKSLRRIARWVTRLIGHVDLTPSDVTLALVLVATLQRRRRRCEHADSRSR